MHRAALSGLVQDSVGHPIRFAKVYVIGGGDSAITDSSGMYRLDSLAAGQRKLRAVFIGYGLQEYDIDLRPGEERRVDFCLSVVYLDYGPPTSPHCPGWDKAP